MRIVGGMWRGRALQTPEGRGTRPTTDRVRESLASMVLSVFDLDLSGVRVLDAFAGSGAMGLEMLSRGAASCTFVERDRRAAAIVRANVKTLGAGRAALVQMGDVLSLASRDAVQGGPFDLVILDPPYAMDAAQVEDLVCDLEHAGRLDEHAVVLYEHASDARELSLEGWQTLRSKTRGVTAVTLLAREANQDEQTADATVDVAISEAFPADKETI